MSRHVFNALGKPLYVLIWIYGIYFAITPLLLKLNPDEGLHVVREGFDKVFNLGVFVAFFWLFSVSRMCWKRVWRPGPPGPKVNSRICSCR